MDRPVVSEGPTLPSTTENPVAAVKQKVKAILGSHQKPSVRIIRQTSPHTVSHGVHDLESNRNSGTQSSHQLSPLGKFRSLFVGKHQQTNDESSENEYDHDTVDLLDVVDPEVSTLNTLTNLQNSLFLPSLGGLVNRRAAYKHTTDYGNARTIDKLKASLRHISSPSGEDNVSGLRQRVQRWRASAITPPPTEFQYAVLPDNQTLPGWTHEEKAELDDIVRHQLHSRRAKFHRSMKGFGKYVRRPLGLFITVYATLITLFGAAWVLFLIGWISLGSKRDYIIDIVDNVLVALFAIIGDGLAPFRAVDTYHMAYIVHYHRKTHKIREESGLPALANKNDLPDQRKQETKPVEVDVESRMARRVPRRLARMIAPRVPERFAQRLTTRSRAQEDETHDYIVLNEDEQAKLEYHERKFSKSHTFYKPHETETHYAFPIKFLIAVVVLLDFHSCLQISLGACTWGIPYKRRPFALTTVILCFSITCNILGGVLISLGDKRTRKHDVIERMMRQELTSEGIQTMETKWIKAAEERGEIDKSLRKKLEEDRGKAENEEIKKAWKVVPMLPKQLLGKGEDHRQPSLPQSARSGSNVAIAEKDKGSSSSSSTPKRTSRTTLPLVKENAAPGPSLPKPVVRKPVPQRGEEPANLGTGQKILRMVRKADLDRS